MSTYSHVRFLMHAWSRASRNLRRPAVLTWTDTDTLQVDKDSLRVPSLPSRMKNALDALEGYIKTVVLCGIPLDSLCASVDLEAFADGGNSESQESQRFTEELLKKAKMGFRSTDGSDLTWDAKDARSWRMNAHQGLLRVFAAMHTTGGLPPRSTDAESFRLGDFIFIPTLQTIGIRSKTGKMKFRAEHVENIDSVIYVFPPLVAKLLFVMVRIVRPVELRLLLRDSGPEGHSTIKELYSSYVFVSMGSFISFSGRSAALKAWTKECIGVELGFRKYRQVATALQRCLLPTLTRNPLAPVNSLEVDDRRLRRTHSESREDADALLFTQLSTDWHNIFGL
ncbi:hypothetical protein B0H12DRAFT_1151742 [Mycena haematopus]|nr:hypothetical protein B0H12DRAFT_1151742 [Mycena haematopus]